MTNEITYCSNPDCEIRDKCIRGGETEELRWSSFWSGGENCIGYMERNDGQHN